LIDVHLNDCRKNKCFQQPAAATLETKSSQQGVERTLDSIPETQNLDAVEKREVR
jgi:hypothetical protein